MAHIAHLDPFAPTAPIPTEAALDYLTENTGIISTLILSRNGNALVFTRVRGWSYLEAEQQARFYDYDTFAYQNLDGTTGAGQMTGRDVFQPIVRRQLTLVA